MPEKPYKFSRHAERLIANLRGVPEDYKPEGHATEKDLSAMIDRLLVRHKIGVDSLEDRIRESWAQIVGPDNAPHCSPARIDRETTLLVAVANPTVRQELEFNKAAILNNVRLLKDGRKIRQVAFKSG